MKGMRSEGAKEVTCAARARKEGEREAGEVIEASGFEDVRTLMGCAVDVNDNAGVSVKMKGSTLETNQEKVSEKGIVCMGTTLTLVGAAVRECLSERVVGRSCRVS